METFWIDSGKIKVSAVALGGRITSLLTPDHNGNIADVVLSPQDLTKGNPFYGAIIGRVANRIKEGKLNLAGKSYQLSINNPPNHLHGGPQGFHAAQWQVVAKKPDTMHLQYKSPAGEEDYPGNVTAEVSYTVKDFDLIIEMKASSDATTAINMSHHCFFNLAGEGNGDILDHRLQINADYFTPLTAHQIPTGEIRPVLGSYFDFKKLKRIGQDINAADEQLTFGNGYDHNYIITQENPATQALTVAARVEEPMNGRCMEVHTNAPGIQLYTGNFMDGTDIGKTGIPYARRTAFCLEPQHFPDALNHPHFPSIILEAGQTYSRTIIYRFGTC